MADNQDQEGKASVPQRARHAFRILLSVPVWLYQKIVSPAIPPHCIYTPSCSEYTRRAILAHGLLGAVAGLMRVFRCVGGLYSGGDDPVPERITVGYLFGSYRRFWHRTDRST
jgi:putative membrane protein insertion efficiency factor